MTCKLRIDQTDHAPRYTLPLMEVREYANRGQARAAFVHRRKRFEERKVRAVIEEAGRADDVLEDAT